MSSRPRLVLAEAIGIVILVAGGPGTAIFAQYLGFNVGLLGVSLAFGFSLLCAAFLFGGITGCHINPAVTVGMWAAKRTEAKDVPFYLIGQVLGAAVGAFAIWAIVEAGNNTASPKLVSKRLFGLVSNGYGTHSPSGFELGAVVIAEVLFTALFVLVIIGVTRRSMPAGFAAIPIGLMLALVHLISIPIDNTSVNPARSFATAIFAPSWAFEQLWVFIVGPVVGALVAAGIWRVLEPVGDDAGDVDAAPLS